VIVRVNVCVLCPLVLRLTFPQEVYLTPPCHLYYIITCLISLDCILVNQYIVYALFVLFYCTVCMSLPTIYPVYLP